MRIIPLLFWQICFSQITKSAKASERLLFEPRLSPVRALLRYPEDAELLTASVAMHGSGSMTMPLGNEGLRRRRAVDQRA